MSLQKLVGCVGLAIIPALSFAQPIDPRCPLPDGPGVATGGSVALLAPGSLSKPMSAAKLGPYTCNRFGCYVGVEVQSFTREDGTAACCVRVEWKEIRAKRADSPVPFRFKLVSKDAKKYGFDTTKGIDVKPPPPVTPADFGPLVVSANRQTATLTSLNHQSLTFMYEVNVSRINGGANPEMTCDVNDPIIVNQGD